jgi:hypothetical protein
VLNSKEETITFHNTLAIDLYIMASHLNNIAGEILEHKDSS